VLFITSADRPFTESERAFLERIRQWGKKVVLVVNKADILEDEAGRAAVRDYVAANARALLGIDPTVFMVSARLARRGRRADPDAWASSRFGPLEEYLYDTLDETERVRLKLESPLGVAERVTGTLGAEVAARGDQLHGDVELIAQLERQLKVYADDLTRDFGFRMADIEKLVVEMERRGHDHFDETIRLARVRDLLDKGRMQRMFEQQVIADTPQRIDRKVNELIDWLVDADFRQWQMVHELLTERRAVHRDHLSRIPQLGRFHHDRTRLIESVGREAERVVETYDRAQEATALAEKARGAVTASAAIEVGAVGLGAVVATVATTAAADMTGLAMAGVVATLGLLVIPNRRRKAKEELREKVTALRERLVSSLRGAFDTELQRSLDRVRQHVEPYSRFVRGEQQHLAQGARVVEELRGRLEALRARVDQVAAGQRG
jgi:hypothetical protein